MSINLNFSASLSGAQMKSALGSTHVPINGTANGSAGDLPQTVDPALRKAVQAFEAVFARQIISSMRTPSLGEDLFGSDAGSQFRDMADSRLADDMARKGSLGLADMMLKQFGVQNE